MHGLNGDVWEMMGKNGTRDNLDELYPLCGSLVVRRYLVGV